MEDEYFFDLDKPSIREIKNEAGEWRIYYKSNQKFTISYSGNITGIAVIPDHGNPTPNNGKETGYITVSYGNVEYKDNGSNITWDESGYIIFHVKEGRKSNYHDVRVEYYLYRRGSKMKV